MTTSARAPGPASGRSPTGRGLVTSVALAGALVLAPRPSQAEPAAAPEPSAGTAEGEPSPAPSEPDERVARATAEPQPPVEPVRDEPRPPEDGRPWIVAGAALVGVGAAVALGGGIGLGVLARQRSEGVEAVQAGDNPQGLSFAQTRALEREGKRLEGIQIGMAAGGAVVAVTGAVLVALGLRERQATRAQAWLGPRLGPGGAGLVLGGRF